MDTESGRDAKLDELEMELAGLRTILTDCDEAFGGDGSAKSIMNLRYACEAAAGALYRETDLENALEAARNPWNGPNTPPDPEHRVLVAVWDEWRCEYSVYFGEWIAKSGWRLHRRDASRPDVHEQVLCWMEVPRPPAGICSDDPVSSQDCGVPPDAD